VSNVLKEHKKHQIIALGRLGWLLRAHPEERWRAPGTASDYLKEDGIAVRSPGGWGRAGTGKTGQ
jgi:hypothetical protein